MRFCKQRNIKKVIVTLIILVVSPLLAFIIFKLSSPESKALAISLTTPANQVQIDVPNRYKVVINTNDTEDYLTFYDRAEDDSNPDATFEFIGPYIREGGTEYQLRYDANRKTTVLESNSLRVKIRVEGCLDTTGGGACLTDGSDNITVWEEYTFTTEGMFVENITDFRTNGVALDNTYAEDGYNWMMMESDVTDLAFGETGFTKSEQTFTPSMTKRNAPGPFAAGAFVQGNTEDTTADDWMTASAGSQISGNFYETVDSSQGTIVFWWTPEYSSSDLSSGYSGFYKSEAWLFIGYDYENNRFGWRGLNSSGNTLNYTVTAGNTYLIVMRWDIDNTIDGSHTTSLSVNDSHNFSGGISSPKTPSYTEIGNIDWGTFEYNHAAHGIIEGLTIYRRPLYDGTYGIDVGNGDEINAIYNSGAGKDSTLTTGSWDVVFALPTNSSTGSLSSGTGEAWTHPHASNLLPGNSNTGGFMLDGTYTNDGWAMVDASGQLTVQPDSSAGRDTFLAGWNGDSTMGSNVTILIVNGSTTLFEFDVSSISTDSTCTSATLSLWSSVAVDTDLTMNINELLSGNENWDDGSSEDPASQGQATYDQRKDYGNENDEDWAGSPGCSTAGTDYAISTIGTIDWPRNNVDTETQSSLTCSDVEDWFGTSNENHGLRIRSSTGSYLWFHTSNATGDDAGYRPKLVVNYTAAPTVETLDSTEKIFAGGYKVTSNLANQGIYDEIAVTSGDDFVIRAVVHSDGTSVPRILITGADDGEITHLDGTTSSTRNDPDVLLFTFEAGVLKILKLS